MTPLTVSSKLSAFAATVSSLLFAAGVTDATPEVALFIAQIMRLEEKAGVSVTVPAAPLLIWADAPPVSEALVTTSTWSAMPLEPSVFSAVTV